MLLLLLMNLDFAGGGFARRIPVETIVSALEGSQNLPNLTASTDRPNLTRSTSSPDLSDSTDRPDLTHTTRTDGEP